MQQLGQHLPILRIALIGAESTGKTTLAAALADYYETVWVPEYARAFLQAKQGLRLLEFMVPIAFGHLTSEEFATTRANKILFADSCLLATSLWSEHYFGYCDPVIRELVDKERYDLYLLLDIDNPWIDDGLRDSLSQRHEFHARLLKELNKRSLPYFLISGSLKTRLSRSIEIIDARIKSTAGK